MKKSKNNLGCLILFGAFAYLISLFLPEKDKSIDLPQSQPLPVDTGNIYKSSNLGSGNTNSENQTKKPPTKLASPPKKTKKTKKAKKASKRRSGSTGRSYGARTYYQGPRGGCYYYSSSGKKVYVGRSLCN
jgi:PBCV-specific basic adaptor domain